MVARFSQVFICATALARLANPIGEIGITRAAASMGVIHMLPTLASCTLDEMLAAKSPGQTQFFQLYVNKDRAISERMIRKAEAGTKSRPRALTPCITRC